MCEPRARVGSEQAQYGNFIDQSCVESNLLLRRELNGVVNDVFVRANFRRYLLTGLLPLPILFVLARIAPNHDP